VKKGLAGVDPSDDGIWLTDAGFEIWKAQA
jgi:hypothetical protein